MHELYSVPKPHWETIYYHFKPFELGQAKHVTEQSNKLGKIIGNAEGPMWKNSKLRMDRKSAQGPFNRADTSRVWKDCAFGRVKGRYQLPGLVSNYMNGDVKVDEFITHGQSVDDINQAFGDMKDRDCIRCVVNMRDAS